jgi:hypothetical protein
MNISDTFYIALCMTILIIGVVYWFWTQTQHLQRKINLLENIVYEFKASVRPEPPSVKEASEEPVYAPAPEDEEDDLLHESLQSDVSPVLRPMSDSESSLEAGATVALSDDLQPGGVGSGLDELMTPEPKIKSSALDGMTLKELRRLGEQRNIPNASTLRKQALIEALRGIPTVVTTEEAAPVFEPSRIELQ